MLNLGILAHVDAGKTSLTERLLYNAGVIDAVGSVDDGNTTTDTLPLERQRGITIKSAVVSFDIGDVTVNLIDTPGHPDFGAEVERVVGVLDGVVLVISAVEGVQAQTRVLMRALRRLHIPTLIFVNKIDRTGAREHDLVADIADTVFPAVLPMGTTVCLGTARALTQDFGPSDDGFVRRLGELLAEHDDELLGAYVADEPGGGYEQLRLELARQTARAEVIPVFFGSAITGAGVPTLITAITELLPASDGAVDAPAAGTVFKIERGPAGEKVAYLRMFAGRIQVRDRLHFRRGIDVGAGQRVTTIALFHGGGVEQSAQLRAGQIGKVWGLTDVRIDDVIDGGQRGDRRRNDPADPTGPRLFPPPTFETIVDPRRAGDRGVLHAALVELSEQDPLINVRRDEQRQQTVVSLYGEIQKEVLRDTLHSDFGVAVTFRETATVCVERLAGHAAAVETMGAQDNPFLATVGLRVEPGPDGSGVQFRLAVELGSMPLAFIRAVEDTVKLTLQQGIHGWQVIDCLVTMTHSGYAPRQSHSHAMFDKSMSSTGADFRQLTPLVLMSALGRAGTQVCEPIHRFRLEIPTDTLSAVMPALGRLRAVPLDSAAPARTTVLTGHIPGAQVPELERRLPGLTRGEGVVESEFDRYQRVLGPVPTRTRWDSNPLDRKEYLLHVQRRV